MPEWRPFPVQVQALVSTSFETLFGGSRGPGKTDTGLVWLIGPEYSPGRNYIHHPLYRALVLRKNADDLNDWLDRAQRMYKPFGGRVVGQPARIQFPSGAVIRCGHLKDRTSYEKYLGHEYQRELIEELTQIPREEYYEQVVGSCRSTVPELRPKVFATTNPGGVGHAWVKRRFIDPAPWGEEFEGRDGRTRRFVHATIDDNPILRDVDPGYVMYLEGLKATNPELYKAWRHGDWDIFAGQALHEWRRDRHVCSRLEVPLEACRKIVSFDRGYNAPGCAVWLAVEPRNRWKARHATAYREIYAERLVPEEWARRIAVWCRIEKTEAVVLPHDCFASVDGRPSYASIFSAALKGTGTRIIRGDTLSAGARHQRLAILHGWLSEASEEPDESRRPYLRLLDRCRDGIRTLPELVVDERDVEDVDTDGEDHFYDALTLGLLWLGDAPKQGGPVSNRPGRDISGRTWELAEDGSSKAPDFQEEFRKAQRRRPKSRKALR